MADSNIKTFTYGIYVFTALSPRTCLIGNSTNPEVHVYGNALIEKTECEESTIIIPAYVEDETGRKYKVIETNQFSFRECKHITSLTIPNTVIKIGRDSFYETSIESLIIPSSVLYLSDSSLSNIRNLSSLIFQPGTNIRKLPLGGLARLTSLKNIIIPPSVKIINQTFKDYYEEHEMNMYYCGSADLSGS